MRRIPLLDLTIDERFLAHRLRSSSVGGMAGAATAGALFFYRYFHDHRVDLDLFAVIAAMAVVKLGLLVYYRFND